MIWYKAWRESRTRFFIGAGVIVVLCLINVLFERRLMPELVHDRPYVHTYGQYMYWKVFGGQVRGMMQTVCLLLGLGGLQRDRKQGTLRLHTRTSGWQNSLDRHSSRSRSAAGGSYRRSSGINFMGSFTSG